MVFFYLVVIITSLYFIVDNIKVGTSTKDDSTRKTSARMMCLWTFFLALAAIEFVQYIGGM